ncbi:MAG TPA: sodium:solute symporter [Thermodesulfobacteriota bacterium]|nr:sodium:solute symporter [Thermodesulfobacteriota bacterium]
MKSPYVDLIIIVTYFVSITFIGIWAGRKESNLNDFALGGRRIPWWAVLASIIAAETSAATFLGAPAEGYRTQNILYVQLALGTILARILIAWLFIKPYYHYNVYTVYEFLEIRFGKITRTIGSLIFLLTRVLASGVRVYIASVILVVAWKYFTGSSPTFSQYISAILIMTVVTAVYTMIGGIKAVIWTDLIQAIIMFGGAIVALLTIFILIPGGWEGIKLGTSDFANFRVFDSGMNGSGDLGAALLGVFNQEYTIWAALFGATFLTLATHGTDQDMVQRMLTASTYKRSRRSLILSGIADIPIALTFVLIGIFLFAFFRVVSDPQVPSAPNEVFAYFIINYMPKGIRGLIIAGVFASAMGSLSAALNALATSAVKDFYIPYLKRDGTEAHYVLVARIFTAFFSILLVLVAVIASYQVIHHPERTIIPMAFGIIGYTYGPLLGVFLIGMLTRTRGNNMGNGIAMSCGFITVLLLSGTANTILGFLRLPLIPLPTIAFTWYIMFGSVVTFLVGILFRSSINQTKQP